MGGAVAPPCPPCPTPLCSPYIHIAGIDVVGVLLSRNHVQHHSVEVICTMFMLNHLCMSGYRGGSRNSCRFSPHVLYMYNVICMDCSHVCVCSQYWRSKHSHSLVIKIENHFMYVCATPGSKVITVGDDP